MQGARKLESEVVRNDFGVVAVITIFWVSSFVVGLYVCGNDSCQFITAFILNLSFIQIESPRAPINGSTNLLKEAWIHQCGSTHTRAKTIHLK